MSAPPLLARRTYDAHELVTAHPPRITDPNKRLVHGLACPPGTRHGGTIEVTRWSAMPLPDRVPDGPLGDELREDIFCYEPPPGDCDEWYVNFADRNLFVAYGGPLFAQDEIQVAEHPALGSIREAMKASTDAGMAPLTRTDTEPTPNEPAERFFRTETSIPPAVVTSSGRWSPSRSTRATWSKLSLVVP
jgi:hypothetical protein